MRFKYYPEANVLLNGKSKKKVVMQYEEDSWSMPKVSKRPPYFTNPQYGWNYPLI